jgi:hypothetical protein
VSRLLPLSERIVSRLSGQRVLWIVMWALIPWVNAGGNLLLEAEARSAIWEQSRMLVILNYAALSLAIGIALWGAERIARRLESLPAATLNVFDVDATDQFREMNSVAGPLLASAATAITFGVSALVEDGLTSALLRGATWFLVGIALWSFLWTYASLQLGLDRLGRERLRPTAVSVDSTLGLRPLGGIAFMGLWMLLASLVPLVLTGLPDIVGVGIGVVVLNVAIAAFFLSLFRLHRRMVEVKETELAVARELYAEAYEPVRSAPSPATLERQHPLLSAADALEKRAHVIHEWPIDEGIVARVITISTSVVGITVARLILDPFGL